MNKFYGVDSADTVDDAKATFIKSSTSQDHQHKVQSDIDAAKAFYGYEEPKKGIALGEPIPGYSGTNQRVEADNVFGMTYAEARRKAKESL